jgi:hypothetical protein
MSGMRPEPGCRLASTSRGARWLLGLVGALALVACERRGEALLPAVPVVESVAPPASVPASSIYSVVPDRFRL